MAQVLVLVMDQTELCPDVLDAWQAVGVPGVTIVESSGTRAEYDETRDDLPFVVSLRSVLETQEHGNRTLFAIIHDEAVVERAANAALRILRGEGKGFHGIMFTLPATRVWDDREYREASSTSAEA